MTLDDHVCRLLRKAKLDVDTSSGGGTLFVAGTPEMFLMPMRRRGWVFVNVTGEDVGKKTAILARLRGKLPDDPKAIADKIISRHRSLNKQFRKHFRSIEAERSYLVRRYAKITGQRVSLVRGLFSQQTIIACRRATWRALASV